MIRRLAPLVAALTATAAAVSPNLHAASAGQLCSPFRHKGLLYRWETVGHWTCGAAKPWVVKLADDLADTSVGNVALKNGPGGLRCWATITLKGRAAGGACFAGTWAYPRSGFTWNGR